MLNPKIFKAYDIRGIYGVDFNADDFYLIIKGVITYIKKVLKKNQLKLVFGFDGRKSTPFLVEGAKKALIDQGVTGVEIGQTTTPTFYFGALKYGYDGGMMITASHNPKEYNGVKMVIRDGEKIIKIGSGSGMETIKEIVLNHRFAPDQFNGKIVQNQKVLEDEVNFAIKKINPKKIKRFKVVTDTANGMAILYLNKFFERIPTDVVRLFDEIDGNFPNHEGNPLKFETLKDLQQKVVEQRADLGIAPDADGDRIFFIDEKGQIVPATIITTLIAKRFLERNPQETILVDVRYIRNVINYVKKVGGRVDLTKVGHAFITKKLSEVNGIFAGESSGHFFFRDTGCAESSISIIVLMFEILSEANKPFSEVVKGIQSSYESGEINFSLPKNIDKNVIMNQIAKQYTDGKINWLDGISVDYSDWRFNIRASNTEPLIRLNVESDRLKLTREKTKKLTELILSFGAKTS